MMRPTPNRARGVGKRIEISNVPVERTQIIKMDIPVQITRRKGEGSFMRKTRTVRNVPLYVPPLPTIGKAFIHIDTDDSTNLAEHKEKAQQPKVLVVDMIIRKLQGSNNQKHPVIVIITPSKFHKNQHKLHLIDRFTRKHLGVTTIKRKEFLQLQCSEALQKYSIVVTNRYLNLKKMAVETAIISNVMNAANLDCCRDKKCEHEECRQYAKKRKAKVKKLYKKSAQPVYSSSQTENSVKSTSSAAQRPVCQPRKCPQLPPKCATRAVSPNTTYTVPLKTSIRKKSEKCFDSWTDFRVMEPRQKLSFIELVKRINVSPMSTDYYQDLQLFFDMIKNNNVKVYIRPELCLKAESYEEGFLRYRLPRFNIECFTLGLTYIGGITLDSQQLEQQLLQHVDILPQVKVITDVCEIIPLPRAIFVILRALCELLCLELFYDAFGEFIFGLCNRIN